MEMVLKLLIYHCFLSPPRIIVFSDNPVAFCESNYHIASRELWKLKKDKEKRAYQLLKKYRSRLHANHIAFHED